ncbi:serine hydrolase domain-containing protein [Microbacterium sp. NPDC055683]
MTRAQTVLDRIVRASDEEGFVAHSAHVRIGDDTAEHRWSDDVRRDIHSVAKGVCVMAAGMASDEGLFDVDAPVATYLPFARDDSDVTTRHLLGMTSGIDLPWSETLMTDWPDLAVEFLSRPTRGRAFQYANASTYTAMRALATVVGDVAEWLEPRLFAPLGIAAPPWDRCPNGHIVAGGGLHLDADELSRLGLLIRDRGVWDGRALVSPGWIDAMHDDWFDRGDGPEPQYRRYALAGWDGPGDAWRLHGAYGQLLIFRGDAVVTITADDHFTADRVAARAVEALAS